jgi:hypothetical protein
MWYPAGAPPGGTQPRRVYQTAATGDNAATIVRSLNARNLLRMIRWNLRLRLCATPATRQRLKPQLLGESPQVLLGELQQRYQGRCQIAAGDPGAAAQA